MILVDSIVKIIQGRKLKRKVKQKFIMRSFLGATLHCMSHYVIPSVNSNSDRIIIRCGTNNLKMDESLDAITEHCRHEYLRYIFLSVKGLLSPIVDLLITSETKLDYNFPKAQFQINGYKDRNIFGGGLCLYINEDIPSKQIYIKLLERLESICIEVKLRKRKWLVIDIYLLSNRSISNRSYYISNRSL